jgi:DNA-binding response OmpR family regulator
MRWTVNCPYCHLPQELPEDAAAIASEAYCGNCGVPLPPLSDAARPATVLWIDDDPLLLGLCVGVLEGHNYRVLAATDGATGIATAKQERPDVILLDVLMPTMSGFEVCRQLRLDPHLTDTPIILLTALPDAEVGRTGKQLGATATLRKPADPAAIVAFLGTVLRRRRGPPQP